MINERRVVITGMGVVTPFGSGVQSLWQHLLNGDSAVQAMPDMQKLGGLRTAVAAIISDIDLNELPRKKRRFMSPMSIYSTVAAMEASTMSQLTQHQITDRSTGLCLASTMGSTTESEAFFQELHDRGSIENVKSSMFFKTMNHSCASNTAQALGITGRIISPSAACASANLAIGLAYEMIAAGHQDVMLCGGTDEHHYLAPAVFDIMNAASCRYNNDPHQTPRPFDINRDGVVCSEGAGILVLEALEHARQRNASILAEISGFATYSTPNNIANPDSKTMVDCMESSIKQSGLNAKDIDYVNAHATATIQGDIAEAQAIRIVFGDKIPVSSLKGHLGHTMAGSGAIELIASIKMMQQGILIPTRNLVTPDPECNGLDFILTPRETEVNIVLKNSFALGGINSTILIRSYRND